jgi:hypothetical protein
MPRASRETATPAERSQPGRPWSSLTWKGEPPPRHRVITAARLPWRGLPSPQPYRDVSARRLAAPHVDRLSKSLDCAARGFVL